LIVQMHTLSTRTSFFLSSVNYNCNKNERIYKMTKRSIILV